MGSERDRLTGSNYGAFFIFGDGLLGGGALYIAFAVTVLRNFSFTDELVGRRFVGYEINGDFCKLCEQRLGSLNEVENTP